MCSFTQRSQRYCNEQGFDYVTPLSIEFTNHYRGVLHAYSDTMEIITDGYEYLVKKDISKEDARYVLPNACSTDLYLSCNLRELIHIANERLCSKAQWEIRELVKRMVELVDDDLKFMLVPKCKSGRIICNTPCKKEEDK
jgi:thymidylate synthase (FAD)